MGFRSSSLAALAFVLVGCGASASHDVTSSNEIREITNAEALEDFGEIASSFRTLYGALERKEARYHFDFETMVNDYKTRIAAASSEADYRALFTEFASRFEDPHVSISWGLTNDSAHSYHLPFSTMPVEDTFVVYAVDHAADALVARGDELVSIDGVAAMDLANSWEKYGSVANHRASMHTAAARLTSRAIYMSRGIDPHVPVTVRLRDAGGVERDVSFTWIETVHALPPRPAPAVPGAGESTRKNAMAYATDIADITTAELNQMGARMPFFMTDAGRATFAGITEVKPSQTTLDRYGVTAEAAANVDYFAMTYMLDGKKVLFVRLPDYSPDDSDAAIGYLRALFDEFQPQVDALVFDETHNPGGLIHFAGQVTTLLAKSTFNDYVQEMHADRKWILSFASMANSPDLAPADAAIVRDQARSIDDAYSTGKTLSPPIPFMGVIPTTQPDAMHWTKPAMMLTDELSVSCADFVPAVVKANGMALLFGQTTMGGGGSVEKVMTLSNTQSSLSISRGQGTVYDPTGAYPDASFIEDNGVSPHVSYTHSLADFRAGYVGYIKAFNAALSAEIKSGSLAH